MTWRKRWACLLLCLVTVLGAVQISAAADSSLQPTIVDIAAKDCRVYSQSGSEINSLAYSAMQQPGSPDAAGITQTAVSDGTTITIKTDDNKNAELRFVVFSTKLWVPAHTKYSARHWFDIGGTRTVSNTKATAASSFQLVYLGTSYDLSGATFTPATSKTASGQIAGLSVGKQLAQAYRVGKDTSGKTSIIGDKESGSAYLYCTYENTSGTDTYISQYFGLWLATQYGSTYSNCAEVTCTLTTKAVQTTAEVTLRKDDQPWTGKRLVAGKGNANLYDLTENTPGVYTDSETDLNMDGTVYYLSFLEGSVVNRSGATLVYPTDAATGSFKKTLDFYTVTYDKGDATSGKLPDEEILLKNTLYEVTWRRPLSKTGYRQTGWSRTLNGTTVGNITIREPVTLYPVWTARTYKVTFDENYTGWTADPVSRSVTYDSSYGTLPAPTRSGYVFMGWYTEEDGGTRVTEDTVVKATADHTLYAHWAVPAKAPTIARITEDQTIVYGKDPHFSLGYGSDIAHKVSEKWYECDRNGNNARLLTDEAGETGFEPVRPTTGVHYYYVELTATRIDNGLSASVKSQVVKVTVEKATPTITAKPRAAAIDLADSRTLSGSALTGGAAKNNNSSPRLDVDGTFTWADGSIKPAVGYQSYTVLFTPNDKDNYNTAECEVSLTVKCSHIWDDGTVTTPPTCTAAGVRTITCSACGATKEESIPATGHKEVTDAAVEATCTTPGKTAGKHCTVCDAVTAAQQETPKLGHDWSEWKVTKAATCTAVGEETRFCQREGCTETESKTVPAAGHKEVTDAAVEATCTTPGKTAGKHCTVCNAVTVAQQETPKLGHDYSKSLDNGSAPTCTEPGKKADMKCTRCDAVQEGAEIPASGHTEVEDPAVPATCTTPGKTAGKHCTVCDAVTVAQQETPKLGHDYSKSLDNGKAPTCTEPGKKTDMKCSRCDAVQEGAVIPASGHTEVEDLAVPATCTTPGKTAGKHCAVCNAVTVAQKEIPKLGHDYSKSLDNGSAPTCTEPGKKTDMKCSRCDAVQEGAVIPASGHTEVEDPAVPATCTTPGKTAGKHCTVCNAVTVAQQETPKLGHDYSKSLDNGSAPTCTEPGKKTDMKCSRCDAVQEGAEIPAGGHTEVDDPAVPATCTTPGKTAGKHCTVCDEVMVAQKEIPALNHDYSKSLDNGKAATCTEPGKESNMKCSHCDAVQEGAVIPANGHTEVEDPAVPATCTTPGKTAGKHCAVCNAVTVAQQETPKLGHDYSKSLNNGSAPTCTEPGKKTDMKCTRCDAVQEGAVIPATGHKEVTDAAVEATCTTPGKTAGKHCAVCSAVTVAQQETPKLGHDWGEWTVTIPATETAEGEKQRVCKRDSSHTETQTIPQLTHTHGFTRENTDTQYLASPATCTEKAMYYYSCTCGEKGVETFASGNVLGHDWSEWRVTKDATCTAAGEETRSCQREGCTETESKTMPAAGHKEVTDAAVEATCTTPGKTAGKHCAVCDEVTVAQKETPKLGHDYSKSLNNGSAPTCTEPGKESNMKCSRCDAVQEGAEIPASGHTEVEDSAVPATCTAPGKTAGKHCTVCSAVTVAQKETPKLGHDYSKSLDNGKAATCTEAGKETDMKCTRCDAVQQGAVIPAGGHTEVEDPAVPATCTAPGKTAGKHCTVCDEVTVAQKETPKLGHDYSKSLDNGSSPTCTEPGKKADMKCTRCDAVQEGAVIPASGHTEIEDPAVPATCTTPGKTAGKHCTVCDAVTVAQKETPKLGHDYSKSLDNGSAATCTEPGKKTDMKCTRCDAVQEGAEIPASGHTEVEDPAVPATCTTPGKTAGKHCAVCDAVTVAQQETPKLGHDYSKSLDNGKAATCTEPGKKTDMKCTRCDAVQEGAEIPASGHTEVEDPAVPTTCTTPGKTAGKHCAVCDEVTVAQKETPKLGHDYSKSLNNGSAPTCTEAGKKTDMKCSRCDAVQEGAVIPAGGHTEVEDPAVPATCMTPGKTAGKHCTVCDEVTVAQKETPKLGHDWGEWTVTIPATETAEGEKQRVCRRDASHTETQPIEKLPHVHSFTRQSTDALYLLSDASCEESAVYYYSCACGEKGTETFSGGTPLGHSWADATCTAPRTCTKCLATEGEPLDHDYADEWQANETDHWHACTRCREKRDEAAHIPGDPATETEPQVCTECGYVLAPALGHTHHYEFVPEVPATCAQTGTAAHYRCSGCGWLFAESEGSYTVIMEEALTLPEDAAAHTGTTGDWQTDGKSHWKVYSCCQIRIEEADHTGGEATCTARAVCEVCGQTYGDLAPHTEVADPAIAPTCTASGLTEGSHCAACDTVITAQAEIPALGHDWQPATCTTPKTCTRCMAAEGQALGHDWSDWAVTTPATESTEGEETRVCGHDASHTETRIIPKITPAPQPSRDDPAGGTTDTGNAADDTGRTVRSSDTGDTDIAFYVLLSLTSLTGTAVICRKWKKNG